MPVSPSTLLTFHSRLCKQSECRMLITGLNSKTPFRAPEPRTDKVCLSSPSQFSPHFPTPLKNRISRNKTKAHAEQTPHNPSASAPSNSKPPASSPKTSLSAHRSSPCSTNLARIKTARMLFLPSRASSRQSLRNWAGWCASWGVRQLRMRGWRENQLL